jgi:hypothetical protein
MPERSATADELTVLIDEGDWAPGDSAAGDSATRRTGLPCSTRASSDSVQPRAIARPGIAITQRLESNVPVVTTSICRRVGNIECPAS